MQRTLNVTVNRGSWPGRTPPSINRLAGTTNVDVYEALIHTAFRTAPPHRSGFHLSDVWAWLRYAPAFANTSDLRLRPEWRELDPHQKTIMSDELGMGFTTMLLAKNLNVVEFNDTIHFLNKLKPSAYRYTKRARRGPSKTPDFIGKDRSGRLFAIECKGTQSGLKPLQDAMDAGVAQKANISITQGRAIHRSLVIGLFIPQFNSTQPATISIQDPSWEELERVIEESDQSTVNQVLLQNELAVHLSLIGLENSSKYFATTPHSDLWSLPEDVLNELLLALENQSDSKMFIDPPSPELVDDGDWRFPKWTLSPNYKLIEELCNTETALEALEAISERELSSAWESNRTDDGTTVITSLGFKAALKRR